MVRLSRPLRQWLARSQEKLKKVEVRGIEHLEQCLDKNHGVLITPNHFCYADVFAVYALVDMVNRPFYFMAAWQVLGNASWFRRCLLRRHGVFTVDREGRDLRAFRQSIDILQTSAYPLVIFPEGEMYHVNDRIMPFEEGPAAIALTAAKRADRPVSCLPCSIKYEYCVDPTPQLHDLMDRLERQFFWRPRTQDPLHKRIYHFAEGLLALKELEYLGQTGAGPLPQRISQLADMVLGQVEQRQRIEALGRNVPQRVKILRRVLREKLEALSKPDSSHRQLLADLEDVFLAVQLFSYPGDYVAEQPTIDRMAETLDKFEEDVFGIVVAAPRGHRHVTVTLGEPVLVRPEQFNKESLTDLLEERVQALLDGSTSQPGSLTAHEQKGVAAASSGNKFI